MYFLLVFYRILFLHFFCSSFFSDYYSLSFPRRFLLLPFPVLLLPSLFILVLSFPPFFLLFFSVSLQIFIIFVSSFSFTFSPSRFLPSLPSSSSPHLSFTLFSLFTFLLLPLLLLRPICVLVSSGKTTPNSINSRQSPSQTLNTILHAVKREGQKITFGSIQAVKSQHSMKCFIKYANINKRKSYKKPNRN